MIRILLGSSYFDGWENEETYVTQDPLGNPVDKNHPWNKTTIPKPQKRDFADKYSWVVSPRIYDKRTDTHVCCDTGGGPFARQWVTAKAGLVDLGYLKATGDSIQMVLPKIAEHARDGARVEGPAVVERDRARPRPLLPPGLLGARRALQPREGAVEVRAGRTKSWNDFKVPEEAVSVGFHEAARGVHLAPHGDPGRQDRELPALPADAVEREPPRRLRDTRAPTRTRCRTRRSSRRTGRRTSRASTSCAPFAASTRACRAACTCTAAGRVRKVVHTPTGLADDGEVDRRRSPRALLGRVQELDERLEASRDPGVREAAEELVATVMELYGEGLERIFGRSRKGAGGPRVRDGLLDDGVVASLLLIHGLTRSRSTSGSRRRSSGCGRTWGRTAATSSCSARGRRRPPAPEGSCNGCPSSASTLELAIKQALDEAAPDLAGIEVEGVVGIGRRRPPAAARSASRPPAGTARRPAVAATRPGRAASNGLDDSRRGAAIGRRRSCRGERRRHAARLPQRVRGVRRRARRASSTTACSPARPARGASSCRWPAGRSAATALQLSRCRCSRDGGREGRGRRLSDAPTADGRRRSDRPAARTGAARRCARAAAAERASAATSAAARSPPTTATCSASRSGAIVCACEPCWALRSGDGPYRPTGTRTALARGLRAPGRALGAFRIPIGLAFFFRSSAAAASWRCTRARPARPSASSTSRAGRSSCALNPVLDGPRGRRRGADRQPAGGARPARDRPDRRVLPARRPHPGQLGGDLRRHAVEDAVAALLRGARGGGAVTEVPTSSAQTRGTPALEFSVARRRGRALTRRPDTALHARA